MKQQFELVRVCRDDTRYPNRLSELGDQAPKEFQAIGNLELLALEKYALICSVRCPGSIILKTYEFVKKLALKNIALASGFHSPMEKECLRIMLRAKAPMIIVLARTMDSLRIAKEWKAALEEKRLLIVSPFQIKSRRVSVSQAEKRNLFVAVVAEKVLIPYAAEGSKTESLAKKIIGYSWPLFTFSDDHNSNLFSIGAQSL